MRSGIIILLWLFIVADAVGQASDTEIFSTNDAVIIKLKKLTMLDKSQFLLGDIATVSQIHGKKSDVLSDIPLGNSPRVGSSLVVTRGKILALIEQLHPGIHQIIRWEGSKRSIITSVGQVLAVDHYVKYAQSSLKQWLMLTTDRFDITQKGSYKDILVPKGVVRIESHLSNKTTLKHRMSVWVDIYVSDEHFRSIPVWFAVEAYNNVLIAKGNMKKGHIISKNDFQSENTNIANKQGSPVQAFDGIINMRLKRPVNTGDIITKNVLENVPEVTEHQKVIIQAQIGTTQLFTKAIALQDGRLGDVITVRNPSSNMSYMATVIGKELLIAEESKNK